MTEQTTPAASDMSPDAPCRVLIAPCGCLVGGDITMSGESAHFLVVVNTKSE